MTFTGSDVYSYTVTEVNLNGIEKKSESRNPYIKKFINLKLNLSNTIDQTFKLDQLEFRAFLVEFQ